MVCCCCQDRVHEAEGAEAILTRLEAEEDAEAEAEGGGGGGGGFDLHSHDADVPGGAVHRAGSNQRINNAIATATPTTPSADPGSAGYDNGNGNGNGGSVISHRSNVSLPLLLLPAVPPLSLTDGDSGNKNSNKAHEEKR